MRSAGVSSDLLIHEYDDADATLQEFLAADGSPTLELLLALIGMYQQAIERIR